VSDHALDATELIEIHQLMSSYGLFIDAQNWDRFGGVFTEDGVFDASGMGLTRCAGRAAILETMSALLPGSVTHMGGNVFAERVDGVVRVMSKWLAATGGTLMGGHYDDVVTHTDGAWRIRERMVTLDWTSPAPS
jgi:hypothetical protein